MVVYTSYFGKLRRLPTDIVPVAVSATVPTGWNGIHLKAICPTYDVFRTYKRGGDFVTFREGYYKYTLAQYDPEQFMEYLEQVTEGKDCALVCYEADPKTCHRSLIAEWLDSAGFSVEEWRG